AEEEKTRLAKAERDRKDKALLATYTNLADFDRVRDRTMNLLDGEIAGLKKQEASEATQRAELQKQVDTAGKKGPSVKLKTDFDNAERELTIVRDLLSRKTSDRAILAANYTTERARLAELIAAEEAAKAAANGAPTKASAAEMLPAKKK
ncbi:MAG: hypothetical protein ACRDAM_14415, partial [Casimicrobium sp.]